NEEERKGATANDKVILGMFKHTEEERKNDFPVDVDELENSVADDVQQARKRKNPFEGLPSYPSEFEPGVLKPIGTIIEANSPINVSMLFTFLTNVCT
ncbi:hypothetical protein A2U01_0056839, partial [Trifolium medium]|nr:hypothetical protein [Trifolium medium]